MLLAVDIGNTNIKMALFKGYKIFHTCRFATDKSATPKQYKRLLKKQLAQKKAKKVAIDEIIICSVVPKLTTILKRTLFSLTKIRPLILGKDIIVPIKNLYKKPKQVGQDRLANAIAAFHKYGGPIVIVDFGTALTFDLVSATGSYLGGVIVPGMELSLKALIKNADLLPKINLARATTLLGKDTISSMRAGMVYGYAALVEGVLQKLKREFKQKPRVITTGGEAALMFGYCRSISRIEQDLTLEGIKVIAKKISRQAETSKK